ncbi:MAG: shikimate dehydrogenase family protein [Gaiellaceae bacterium]
MIGGTTRLVGLLRDPVASSLSPRMQNAAFAARALDVAYVPLGVAPALLADAVRGLVAFDFLGANVTTPHKRAVVALCDEVEGDVESVNTFVIRDGRVLGSSTDTEALGDRRPATAAVVGAGGAALAWIAELEARGAAVDVFSRKGVWPPRTEDAELVVQATPVKDELLFEPRPGQTVIELAYRAEGGETAHAAAARAAGCELVDGLDVLVAQGAASFERWTGLPAPVDVMRAAVRSPA